MQTSLRRYEVRGETVLNIDAHCVPFDLVAMRVDGQSKERLRGEFHRLNINGTFHVPSPLKTPTGLRCWWRRSMTILGTMTPKLIDRLHQQRSPVGVLSGE